MTYNQYINNKKKHHKIIFRLIVLFTAYFAITLLIKSLLLSVLFLVICLIPGLAIYNTLEDQIKKKKLKEDEMNFSSEEELILIKKKKSRGSKKQYSNYVLLPILLLVLIYTLEMTSSLKGQIMHISFTVIIFSLILLSNRIYKAYDLILFDQGIIINNDLLSYDELKKYQKIKLRNGHSILEIQMKDVYTSMVLSEDDIKTFEKALTKYKI